MIKLWFIPKNVSCDLLSKEEITWADGLSELRSHEYKHSRSHLRRVLANLFKMYYLDIPLFAPPSKSPELTNDDLGYVSISHSRNSLLLGWANSPIGIDIEHSDRKISLNGISSRFFTDYEKMILNKIDKNDKNSSPSSALKLWVSKEAAIKWQRGKLFKDIINWECNYETRKLINIKSNLEVNFKSFIFQRHHIAVASNCIKDDTTLLICSEKGKY